MTSMEHAIEQAEMVERLALRLWDDGLVRPEYVAVEVVETLLRCLAEDGLLAPAPLREEWAAAWEGLGATRIGFVKESPGDIEGIPPGGWVVRRYVTDWHPVDGVNRAEGDGRAVL